jgi:hypothetical protein
VRNGSPQEIARLNNRSFHSVEFNEEKNMNKLLLLTLALSLSVAQVMRSDNDNDRKRHKRQNEQAAADRSEQAGPAGQAVRQPGRRPMPQQPQRPPVRTQQNTARAPHSTMPASRPPVRSEAQLDGRNRTRTQAADEAGTQNRNINRNRNNSQGSVQRNGDNRSFNRNSFNVARSRVIRTPHNRNWWRSHFNTTFVLFGGGYYYWWDGYWFPAYGYSPYYNNYIYSEPIYGYNNLDPGQVIENVQLALRDAGYYPGVIDGLVGPQTRDALAAYQRDHGLIVTAAVDEPTLVTLGLA